MKAAFTVIQSILMLLIAVVMTVALIPWAIETIGVSFDMTEISSIKSQFDACSERILETARTGNTNKCIFNIKNGEITGRTEGIYYSIVSDGPICDQSDLKLIDPKTHVYQECNVSEETRSFGMLWMFPKELNISGTGVSGNLVGESSSGDIGFGEDGGDITFRTLSLSVQFEYNPGQIGNIVQMSRLNITSKNVTLRVEID